jgi:hypothetical protein
MINTVAVLGAENQMNLCFVFSEYEYLLFGHIITIQICR